MDLVLPRMLELNTLQADDAAGLMMSVLQVFVNLQTSKDESIPLVVHSQAAGIH